MVSAYRLKSTRRAHVHWQAGFLAGDGSSPLVHHPTVCATLRRQPQGQVLPVFGSLPLYGLPPLTLAQLYRSRWQIELFFRWIKQHLRIKAYYGTSENAVKSQIWIAVSVYVLIAIIKKRLQLEPNLYTILQILSLTVFEKTPLNQLLRKKPHILQRQQPAKQLILFD